MCYQCIMVSIQPLEEIADSEIILVPGPLSLLVSDYNQLEVPEAGLNLLTRYIASGDQNPLRWRLDRRDTANPKIRSIQLMDNNLTQVEMSNGVKYEFHQNRDTLPKDVRLQEVPFSDYLRLALQITNRA